MENIFEHIEYSEISKGSLKRTLQRCMKRAKLNSDCTSSQEDIERIGFDYFKIWLHAKLKHRTQEPVSYKGCLADKEYTEQLLRYSNENRMSNFRYSLEDIRNYIYEGSKNMEHLLKVSICAEAGKAYLKHYSGKETTLFFTKDSLLVYCDEQYFPSAEQSEEVWVQDTYDEIAETFKDVDAEEIEEILKQITPYAFKTIEEIWALQDR